MKPPFTDWASVPLVAGIDDTARALNRSVRSITRDLSLGCMVPEPMAVVHPKGRKRMPRQWSKAALQAWVNGGYRAFIEGAPTRKFFGSTRDLRRTG